MSLILLPPTRVLPHTLVLASTGVKISVMATKEALFACTHCHKRCKFEELSSTQQLCKVRVCVASHFA